MQRTVSSTGGANVGKANEGLLVITQILRGVFNGLSRVQMFLCAARQPALGAV